MINMKRAPTKPAPMRDIRQEYIPLTSAAEKKANQCLDKPLEMHSENQLDIEN